MSGSRLKGINAYEPILVYGDVKKRIGQDVYIYNVETSRQVDNTKSGEAQGYFEEVPKAMQHPCPKALNFWKKLITDFSDEKDYILDPFMGTGTTALACEVLDRNWIGFELYPEYKNIIKRRISGRSKWF